MKIRIFFVVLSLIIATVAFVGFGADAQNRISCSSRDNDVYDGRIEQVKGKVKILNHPELGKTPAAGQYLVFQREDCKDCLVATHTDFDGNYKIFVGVGRYKLIVNENRCEVSGTGCTCYDLLEKDQPRYIDVERNRPYTAEFNINITLPKN